MSSNLYTRITWKSFFFFTNFQKHKLKYTWEKKDSTQEH